MPKLDEIWKVNRHRRLKGRWLIIMKCGQGNWRVDVVIRSS